LGPDDVSWYDICAKRTLGSAGDVFDFPALFLVREEKPSLAECKQFLRLDRFDFVFGVARLLKKFSVPSDKATALEIYNCSRQCEFIQDRAEFLQVLR
jgi:hypothetical protein